MNKDCEWATWPNKKRRAGTKEKKRKELMISSVQRRWFLYAFLRWVNGLYGRENVRQTGNWVPPDWHFDSVNYRIPAMSRPRLELSAIFRRVSITAGLGTLGIKTRCYF